MSISVSVRGSMDKIIADIERTKRDVVEKATVRALNKIIAQVKTGASRNIRDAGYNLKASDIKKGLSITRATASNLSAKVIASGRPIPLIKYGARPTSKGVSVEVLHGRKVLANAFIVTMPSGHKGVYVRVGDRHKKVRKNDRVIWSGLPIKELFGPSIPNGLANKTVQEALQKLVQEKFPDIMRQQIKYLSSK
ncbi:phage tail protein [Undibacterium sp. Ji42W]|uniref:phage tail protein n=1 Tax=Undibacterium sp. Ji42W TaxID=3413039 RepID=UPI003BF2C58E